MKTILPEQKTELHQTAGEPRGLQGKPEKSTPEPEPFPTFQLSDKRRFIKRLKGGNLVWRNEDGSLGFGNIQYPLTEDLTIFDGEEWLQISRSRSRLAYSDAAAQQ